ncbi:MAG: hypothetical protein ACREJ3_02130 [Polyangiaceae bacterium]
MAAYEARPRGVRVLVEASEIACAIEPLRWECAAGADAGTFNAGVALAMVYPLVKRLRLAFGHHPEIRHVAGQAHDKGAGMKRRPQIKSLETVSAEEAAAYLDHVRGDELGAAYALALDRSMLDGSRSLPDDAEDHHALFLLCRARGMRPPSFDEMRVELRRRAAA